MIDDPDAPPVRKQHPWPTKSRFNSKCGCEVEDLVKIGDLIFLMTDGTIRSKAHAQRFTVDPDYRPAAQPNGTLSSPTNERNTP